MREEWKVISISDLGRVVTGNTPPRKSPELYGKHTIFIKPTDISEETKFTYHPEECYSELGYKKYKTSLIPKGATCVVTIGSIGKKMTKAHCDCFINQAMNAVIPSEEYDEEFVYYVLKYNLDQLKVLDSGTASGRENVSKSAFSSIKIKVPNNKSVQIKIGKILSAYDDLIENNLRRIKLLEELAQRTYEEWFVRFRVNGVQLEVDAETGLPLGWRYGKVEDLFILQRGFDLPTQNRIDGVFPIISSTGITGYHNEFKVKGIGVVTGRSGTIGSVILVHDNFWPLNTSLWIKNYNQTGPYFAFLFLKNFDLKKLKGGSAVPSLDRNVVHAQSCIIPVDGILKEFENTVEDNYKLIENLTTQNRHLKTSRDLLLPRLMSGEVEV